MDIVAVSTVVGHGRGAANSPYGGCHCCSLGVDGGIAVYGRTLYGYTLLQAAEVDNAEDADAEEQEVKTTETLIDDENNN